jgi:hypothetical protein
VSIVCKTLDIRQSTLMDFPASLSRVEVRFSLSNDALSREKRAMFRQVVVYRWVEGVADDRKRAFRDSMDSLRDIPELIAMKFGEDAGHFEGNFDFAAVMDFADFDSARRYVVNPIHQAYIRDHASQVIGERVVVQHEWDVLAEQ